MFKALSGLAILALLFGEACSVRPEPVEASAASTAEPAAPPLALPPGSAMPAVSHQPLELPGAASPWQVSTSRYQSMDEEQIAATSDNRSATLLIRQIGTKLECYLLSGNQLDTMNVPSSRRSQVKYKFDDGELINENWLVSDHATALRYPGDTMRFVRKISQSKHLELEVSRGNDSFDIETFNLALFPVALISGLSRSTD